MRTAIDISMLAACGLVMAYTWTGNLGHEVIGVLLGVLVFAHGALSFTWLKNVVCRVNIHRILRVRNLLNAILVLVFLGSLITGILHSQSLFPFWPWNGNLLLRQWHVAFSYWFLIFVAIHVGLHWNDIAHKLLPWNFAGFPMVASWILALMLSVLGAWSLIVHEIHYKLILYYAFSFPDEGASAIKNLCDHVLMLFPFAFIAYSLDRKPWKYHGKK